MKRSLLLVCIALILVSCKNGEETNLPDKLNIKIREAEAAEYEDLFQGQTYLPIYSHIYHRLDNHTFNLTITVSMRNISSTDSTYILNADYYNTEGDKIRQYFKHPVYLKPMETIEIIIQEDDEEGGSGGNFIFNWATKNEKNPPLFEAVMISTYGQQGLSFVTRGVRVLE